MSNLICSQGTSSYPNPNHEILSDRVTYTLSCLSADQLGPSVINIDGISYIGYDSLLYICLVEGDDLDAVFKDILAGGAFVLIEGKTTKDAYNWLKSRYKMWIEYWEMKSQSWIKPIILASLKYDSIALKLLGKKDAIIRSAHKKNKNDR